MSDCQRSALKNKVLINFYLATDALMSCDTCVCEAVGSTPPLLSSLLQELCFGIGRASDV